jgi:hypothetical protein
METLHQVKTVKSLIKINLDQKMILYNNLVFNTPIDDE